MLGHKSAAMTLDTYADLFEDDLADVAERMNRGGVNADVGRGRPDAVTFAYAPKVCGRSVGDAAWHDQPGPMKWAREPRHSAALEPVHVTADWWRWGESNPRPSLCLCAFYGRSLC